MGNRLEELLDEEKELQFKSFNEMDAWKLGNLIVEKAMTDKLPVAVDITCFGKQLFHASLPGATPDNDAWIKRKINLVNRFCHSSYYLGQYLKSTGKTIEGAWLVPESEYAPHGGCFPVTVRDCGTVGTITVSGLPQEEDHKLVVSVLRSYLS